MSEKSDRYNQVFAFGTILARVVDILHWAIVTRPVRGDTTTESVVTVSNVADTVIAARPGRLRLTLQVQGNASPVLVSLSGAVPGGTTGELLDQGPAAGRPGGQLAEEGWPGPVAMRATVAPVTVLVREVY